MRKSPSLLPLLTAILLLAAAFRILGLTRVPPGLQHDEVFHAHDAYTVREGRLSLWFESNAGNEPLYIYLMAVSTGLIGDNAPGIRLTAAWCGLLALALTYRWVAATGNRRAGWLAAGFMAVAFWPVWMSRVGLRAVSLPAMAALTAATLAALPCRKDATLSPSSAFSVVEAVRRSPFTGGGRCLIGGAALGLALYTYPAAYALPLAVAAYQLYLALWRREKVWGAGIGLYWLAAMLVYLPLGAAILSAGGYLRVQQTALPIEALREGDPLPLLDAAWKTLLMWTTRGDPLWRYNVAGRPVFGIGLATLFVVGVGVCLWKALARSSKRGDPDRQEPQRAQRTQRTAEGAALILLLLFLGILPSAATDSPPAFLRASAALPATFAALGIGIDAVWGWLDRRAPGHGWLWGALAGALIVLSGATTYRDYFVVWAGSEEVQRVYRADLAQIAAFLQTHPPPGGAAISTTEPNHLDRFIFDYTPHGEADVRWFDGLYAIVAPGGGEPGWVFLSREPTPRDELRREFYDQLPVIEERVFPNGALAYRLYAVPPGEAFFEQFPPPTGQGAWVSDALAFPPDDPDGLRRALALPVRFGDVIELAGYAAPESTPARQWLTLRLYFRVLADVRTPEAWNLFAHLLDAGGQVVAGRDFLAVPPSTWRAGDVFVQLHDLPLPDDLAAGLYTVEIGFYQQADGARFPLLVDGARVGDRLLLQPVEVTRP